MVVEGSEGTSYLVTGTTVRENTKLHSLFGLHLIRVSPEYYSSQLSSFPAPAQDASRITESPSTSIFPQSIITSLRRLASLAAISDQQVHHFTVPLRQLPPPLVPFAHHTSGQLTHHLHLCVALALTHTSIQ